MKKQIILIITVITASIILLLNPWAEVSFSYTPSTDYPIYRLSLDAKAPQDPIKLFGARGEHLLLVFEISQVKDRSLSVSLREKSGASLELQAYLMPPLPDASGQENLFDALMPLEQASSFGQEVARLAVILKIPTGHPVGAQRLDLVFRFNGGVILQPLELRIWNFTLPDDLPVTVLGNFWPQKEWFGRYGVQGEVAFTRTIAAYLRFLRPYKINAIGNFYPLPTLELAQGRSLNDFPAYLQLLDQALSLGYQYFRLPIFPNAKNIGTHDNIFERYAKEYYTNMANFLKSRHLLGKALVKVWDEPKPADYTRVAQAYALVKEAAPELLTESAGRMPDPSLARFIDIWAVYNAFFDQEKVKANLQAGQKIWLYANLLHGVDKPAICRRLVGWYLFQSGASGYLLWSVNYWPHDPWTQPPSKKDFFRRGTLIYPHPSTGLPLPSLRLEIMRRGWEDYQYLVLLKEATKQGKVNPAVYAKIQKQVAAAIGDIQKSDPQTSWQHLEELRLQIGELLDQATGGKHD
jgi:hypothetical protein